MRRTADADILSDDPSRQEDEGDVAVYRNAPQPDSACHYGLIGDVARAGSDGPETNAHSIAANFLAYLACAVGRGVYLSIGNTRHRTRLFCLHLGRSGRGRKGDAVSLVPRIDHPAGVSRVIVESVNSGSCVLHCAVLHL